MPIISPCGVKRFSALPVLRTQNPVRRILDHTALIMLEFSKGSNLQPARCYHLRIYRPVIAPIRPATSTPSVYQIATKGMALSSQWNE